MTDFFIYYIESNVICIVIFGIFLAHDLLGVDRQERQIKYDHALVAFMLYFLSDIVWAAMVAGYIPTNAVTAAICNFINYILMSGITYTWLSYVMAVEKTPHRERPLNKFAVIFPFIVSTISLLIVFFVAPHVLFDENYMILPVYNIFLVVVPCINIGAVIMYTVKKARYERNPVEKKKHIYIGAFPLIAVFAGLIQIVFLPDKPIFCFGCTILMLLIYIQSMETQISMDPLTKLNNRSQLMRYINQASNLHIEGKRTFVVMADVNNFKSINDTYGHAEGDTALTTVADSFKNAVSETGTSAFIGRYGGDEFVLIVYVTDVSELPDLITAVRRKIDSVCEENDLPYKLSVSAGYDELLRGNDTFQKCILRADKKLYLDKEYCKLNADK